MHKQYLYSVKKRRISLTALIDVVFILLLFFMLTTSFSQWRVVNVSTATSTGSVSNKETVRMLLLADEAVALYGQHKTFDAYHDIKLEDLGLTHGDDAVVLLPHQEVPLQLLINVTQHLAAIGLDNVAVGHSFGEELAIGQDGGRGQ